MSRDNSSQPLKYAARHSVNYLAVLALVWCSHAVAIRSPNSVLRGEFTKKKPSTSGKPALVTYSSRCFILVFVWYSIATNPHITRWSALQGSHSALRTVLHDVLVASVP
ncbi:hypothetical protein TcCL_NonESM02608 [Trypanosoma cruzi]|nr:hypothetical protein TcCL_NonESM02608 [Trypanosoma cruzi]